MADQLSAIRSREADQAKVLEDSVRANVAQYLMKAEKIRSKVSSSLDSLLAIQKYFDQKAKIYATMKGLLGQLPTGLHVGETGTMESGLDFVARVAASELEQFSLLTHDIQATTLKSLQTIHSELQTFSVKVNTFVSEAREFSTEKFQKALAAWSVALEEKQGHSQDPFLLQTQFYTAALALVQSLASWRSQLAQLFQEFTVMEKKRIETIKSAVRGSVLNHKNALSKVTKEAEVALTVLDGVSPTNDCDAFIRNSELLTTNDTNFADTLSPDPDVSKFTAVLSSPLTIRFGELELSGLISWSKFVFVLTSFGYLHYFANKGKAGGAMVLDLLRPEESIDLRHCKISMGEAKKSCFQLVFTPSGFFSRSKTYSLRCASEQEMSEWLLAVQRFCGTAAPSAAST